MEKIYSSIFEISMNDLIEYKSQDPNKSIIIKNPNKSSDNIETYSLDDMIHIKEKVAKIISNIPETIKEPDKEKKIFTYLYTKLSYLIEYDEYATFTAIQNVKNLIGKLLDKTKTNLEK